MVRKFRFLLIIYVTNSQNIFIFSLFLVALLIRTIHLTNIPNGFHIDEIVSGFVGRFILLHGKDPYGNIAPLFYFDMFGDYRVILPMYINGLSTFIFGVNEFAVRFPTAFFGSLIVFPIFSIAKIILGNRKIAFLPPLVIALLPWHIVLSRATAEGILGLTIFTFGLFYIFKFLSEKKITYLYFSGIFLFLTYFLYPTFRLLTPIVLFPIPLLIMNKSHRMKSLIFFICFILFTSIVGLTVWGKGRYVQTSLFTNVDIARSVQGNNIASSFSEGTNSIFVARLFNNKINSYFQLFVEGYLSYFSPIFLFTRGGLPDRYVVPDMGLLYVSFLIVLFFLLMPQKNTVKDTYYYYLLYLLFLSPLPSAMTIDDAPNIHRSLFMMIPIIFLVTIGVLQIRNIFSEKLKYVSFAIFGLAFFLTLGEFIYFEHRYNVQSPAYKSILRDDGNKQLILFIARVSNKPVYMPVYESLPVYYLFYTNNFNKQFAGKFNKEMTIDKINNITFVPDWCPLNMLNRKQLPKDAVIVDSGNCHDAPSDAKIVLRKDSTIAFKIFNFTP